jgi:hypothetical protein
VLTLNMLALILLVGIALATIVPALAVTLGTEPRQARHARGSTDAGDRVAGPVTGPILLGDRHGHATAISMPTPRPYTPPAGLPALIVDSPPTARGSRPADLAGVPISRRRSCSFCLDGTRTLLPGLPCDVCGAAPSGAAQ